MFQLSKELNVVGLNSKQWNESKDCKSLRNTRSTDSFVNSYQIDDDNTYGYSESKPLANNMGNQSFVNFKSKLRNKHLDDSDSKFDSFIANLQKQKSERR